jgi:hypothetical protein
MKEKKNPRLTLSEREWETLRFDAARSTSTSDARLSRRARETVAAVLAAALRAEGKL